MHHLIATLTTLGIRLRDRHERQDTEAGYTTVEMVVLVAFVLMLAAGAMAIIRMLVDGQLALIR